MFKRLAHIFTARRNKATTVVLLLLALIGGIWTLRKSRKSTLLRHTRHELANDRQLLEEESREQ